MTDRVVTRNYQGEEFRATPGMIKPTFIKGSGFYEVPRAYVDVPDAWIGQATRL